MCLAILNLDPESLWPVKLAFIRDEDRTRPTNTPNYWWGDDLFGGQDVIGLGTWLCVNAKTKQLSFLLNRLDAPPPPAYDYVQTSRGTLPLTLLKTLNASSAQLDVSTFKTVAPCVLVGVDNKAQSQAYQWHEQELSRIELTDGYHFVNRWGVDNFKHPRQALAAKLTDNIPDVSPSLNLTSGNAWGEWIELLDGRSAEFGDDNQMVVRGVLHDQTFGTRGATLIGISRDGAIRYDINESHDLSPDQWEQVDL